jgi:hypothetical protein
VLQKFILRSEMGKKKYGVTLDRNDLSVLDWIQHAQEEHMDAILYLEKLKQMLGGPFGAASPTPPRPAQPKSASTP